MTEGRSFPTIAGQRGLATRRQLVEAGWTVSAIRHAERRVIQQVYPGVYLPHRLAVAEDVGLIAAALWAGPRALLTGTRALLQLKILLRVPRQIDFLVPTTARARHHGRLRTRRTDRLPEPVQEIGPLRVAPAGRALVDAAVLAQRPSLDLTAATITALQRRLTTPESLTRELWGRPMPATQTIRAGLEAFTEGAWSKPESVLPQLLEQVRDTGPVLLNCRLLDRDGLELGTVDAYLEQHGVALQVHSRQFHQGVDDQGGDRWARTVEKDSAYVAAGVRVLGVTPWSIYRRPKPVIERIAATLAVTAPAPKVTIGGYAGRWVASSADPGAPGRSTADSSMAD